jgi:hypothetical protein
MFKNDLKLYAYPMAGNAGGTSASLENERAGYRDRDRLELRPEVYRLKIA